MSKLKSPVRRPGQRPDEDDEDEEVNEAAEEAFDRGEDYADKEKYDRAIAEYNKAIELVPDNEKYYRARGVAYRDKEEYDLARADFNKAIELAPDEWASYSYRAATYYLAEEYDLAIAYYTEAIQLFPDEDNLYEGRAKVYKEKGEYDLAIADYTEAIRLYPDDDDDDSDYASLFASLYADLYDSRAEMYKEKGEYDLAIADWKKAIKLDPDFVYYRESLKEAQQLKKTGAVPAAASAPSAAVAVVNDESLAVFSRRSIIVLADGASPRSGALPCYTMTKAKELFNFPPNHPAPGTAYAMIEVYPDSYVLLNQFHEYYKQTKHAAFIELCAGLGAKEILIESAEINNQELNVNADIKAPLTKLGLGLSVSQNRETGQTVAFKFSEKNRDIKDYDSPWLYTEPSWMSMNNLRRKNHLSELGAEFTCLDDMGINASLTAELFKAGINIGGSFKEMTKIRLSYKVVFWE